MPNIRFKFFENDWIETTLHDISLINPSTPVLPENFIYIDLDSVNDGVLTKVKKININEAPSRAQRYLHKGDILFQTVRPYQMNNYYFNLDDTKYVASTGYAQIRSKIYPKFLYYYLHNPRFIKEVLRRCTGTSYPSINSADLKKIKIKIPSSEKEKMMIGNLFANIDQKRISMEKKYKTLQKYKSALIQQIFTKNIRFSNFSNNWNHYSLGELGETYSGLTGLSKENFEHGNSKFIPYKVIFDNEVIDINSLEPVQLNNKKQEQVKKGDLFFTGSSETPEEVGMVSVLNKNIENCYLNSFCFGYRLNDFMKVNPLFLSYLLRSPLIRREIKVLGQGSTRFNISKKEIMKLTVEIPSLEEQKKIITLLENLTNTIHFMKNKNSKIKEFKKYLLQQMFV